MKLFAVVERVMIRLSAIPGLRFLGDYVVQFHGRETRIQQTISSYQGYVRAARDAGAEVGQATRGSKQDAPDDEEIGSEYDSDDDESYMQ